jgi:mannose-1-phosphate guanylyltransferase
MVMAAGLGTRLRPLTWEIPKPVVPICNRPIVAHLAKLMADGGVDHVIANLHWFPEIVRGHLDRAAADVEIAYRFEEELLGTAGGVRNVADFLTAADDDAFVVLAGDALTDIDLRALLAAHRANGGIATLAVKKVVDVSQYGVIVTDGEGRIQGFQEKPEPAEALSDLVNCMVYAFSPEIFDFFPAGDPIDFALDVFPALLEADVPFHVHEIDGYWNDIGTLPEYLNGNFAALAGEVGYAPVGELREDNAAGLGDNVDLTGRVLLGEGAEIGAGASLTGPLVVAPGVRIGAGARVREAVLLPGAEVPDGAVLARGIAGGAARLASTDW